MPSPSSSGRLSPDYTTASREPRRPSWREAQSPRSGSLDASSLSSSWGPDDLDSPTSPAPVADAASAHLASVGEAPGAGLYRDERRASNRSARRSDPELGDLDRRRSSLLGEEDGLADELAAGVARVEAHVAAPSPDLVSCKRGGVSTRRETKPVSADAAPRTDAATGRLWIAGTIQRHVEHAVVAAPNSFGLRRVARVSDPVITSDMVRRKSSLDLEDLHTPDAL